MITAAAGFRAAGAAIGIKKTGAHDIALIAADRPVPATAVFTTSLAAAPPVQLGRRRLQNGTIQAVLINSGIANAGTGDPGLADAMAVGAAVAEQLGCDENEVLVCSTGVIGPRIPVDRILSSIPALVFDLDADRSHAEAAARGIMTTDSVPKEAVAEGDGWVLGGMAKGAGMIRPDMATMLAYPHDRRGARRRRNGSDAQGGGGRHLQLPQRRRLPVDERHRSPHGFRCLRRRSLILACSRRHWRLSAGIWPCRWPRTPKGPRRSSRSR